MQTETPATLYRRSVDPATRSDIYSREVLAAVHWESGKSARFGKTPTISQASVYIPAAVLPMSSQPLKPGDIIVRGEVTDELTQVFTPSDLRAAYTDALVVTSCDKVDYGNTNMRHWKVGAE